MGLVAGILRSPLPCALVRVNAEYTAEAYSTPLYAEDLFE